MKSIAAYLLLFLLSCPFCFSDYVLRIRAVRYENPTDEDYDGGSCDPIFSDCDVYFHFCIRAVNLSPSNPDNCWDTITTSSSFESTNKTFPITGSLYPGANAQNPLTFSSNNAWPGSFQLLVSSIDNDDTNSINTDDLIDRNAFNLDLNPTTGDNFSNPITTTGFYNKVNFTVHVQLSCTSGWTGSDCEQCIPRAGCSSTNGRCTQPGECICNDGYTGVDCTQQMHVTTTSSPSHTNYGTTSPPTESSISTPMSSGSSNPSPSTTPPPGSAESNLAAIVGGAAAGGVIILIIIIVSCVIVASYFIIKFSKKEKSSLRNEVPEPFNKNVMYIPPEVLDPNVKVKQSGSHYAKGLHQVPANNGSSNHAGAPLPKLPAGTRDITYDKLEAGDNNYAQPAYSTYY